MTYSFKFNLAVYKNRYLPNNNIYYKNNKITDGDL